MIDFTQSDEQLINTFGEVVKIKDQSIIAVFDEMPSDFDRSEDAQYRLTILEKTAPPISRDDLAVVRQVNYYVRSIQSTNGVLEVILNR